MKKPSRISVIYFRSSFFLVSPYSAAPALPPAPLALTYLINVIDGKTWLVIFEGITCLHKSSIIEEQMIMNKSKLHVCVIDFFIFLSKMILLLIID